MADDGLDFDTLAAIVQQANKEEDKSERRKKRDLLTILPVVLSLLSFVVVIAVWFIWDMANPYPTGTSWAWLTFFGLQPQEGLRWPRRPINIAYIMLIASMVMCVIAFICNIRRMKRKGDKYSVSVFLVGAIALVTFVSFLVQFLPMGIIGVW